MRFSAFVLSAAILGLPACARREVPARFKKVPTQFIAALADRLRVPEVVHNSGVYGTSTRVLAE